jgi:lipoprotein-anchoring transpeptidase ErfK/SrfK
VTATLLGTTALATVLAGCTATATASSPATTAASASHSSGAPPARPAVLPASVAITPASGAHGVNPASTVSVAVAHGRISSIALTNAAGRVVTGTLSADHATWTANEALGYGKTYTWTGSAADGNGRRTPIRGSFTTLTPSRQISGQLNVGDGKTYGIAMPISLTFSSAVTDRAAVQKALTVKTSKPTTGTWAWLDGQTVHWRPKTYYTPGTKVTVAADLYGVAFAPGVYGRSDVSAHFTIGRSQIVKADTRTHRMLVYTNGRKTADFPASFGLDSDPGRNTHSGVHVVMSRSETYFMSNPKYHYADVEVHWAVRISNNGEFVHGAPWSVADQGRRNVSHGCVNLSTANALWYYKSVLPGDPVQITGSPIKLGPSDGDYYDWTMSWAQWQARSALRV